MTTTHALVRAELRYYWTEPGTDYPVGMSHPDCWVAHLSYGDADHPARVERVRLMTAHSHDDAVVALRELVEARRGEWEAGRLDTHRTTQDERTWTTGWFA